MEKWDERWLNLAGVIASWSKDRRTKVGCVIVGQANQVLSAGYNGFPRGVDDDQDARHARPDKYLWTEHAERNAVYNAARHGIRLEGATAYVPWHPCAACARALAQAGVAELVTVAPDLDNANWGHEFPVAQAVLAEAGVTVRYVTLPAILP